MHYRRALWHCFSAVCALLRANWVRGAGRHVFVTAPHCLIICTHTEEVPVDEQRLSDYWLPWTVQLQALTATGVNAADDEALPEG